MQKPKNLRINAFFIAALFVYLLYLSYLTFFSSFFGRTVPHRSINLIPFRTIIHYMMTPSSVRNVIVNIVGNVASFIPMGFLLPLASEKRKTFSSVIMRVLIASAIIEIMQYVSGVGVSDIDDLILNSIGGIFGYLVYKVCMKAFARLTGNTNARDM